MNQTELTQKAEKRESVIIVPIENWRTMKEMDNMWAEGEDERGLYLYPKDYAVYALLSNMGLARLGFDQNKPTVSHVRVFPPQEYWL